MGSGLYYVLNGCAVGRYGDSRRHRGHFAVAEPITAAACQECGVRSIKYISEVGLPESVLVPGLYFMLSPWEDR